MLGHEGEHRTSQHQRLIGCTFNASPMLPKQARDGLMRAWLEILHERHPGVTLAAGP